MRGGSRIIGGTEKKLAIAYHFERTGDRRLQQFDCGHCKRLKLHKGRNCKFFPADWIEGRKENAWFAQYKHRDHWEGQRKVTGQHQRVQSTVLSECPTSFITAESQFLLSEYLAAFTAHQEFGAVQYGSNPNRWPAWWFDVVTTIANAKHEADSIVTTDR